MATGASLYGMDEECWICHRAPAVRHHIYAGSGRRGISDREGCWVYLCPAHHNMSDFGVHSDMELNRFFKRDCQRRWCAANDATAEDFRKVFGTSYT